MSYTDYSKRMLAKYRDGASVYRALVSENLGSVKSALHLGCGRDLGGMRKLFPGDIRVVGVDPDADAVSEYPGEARVGDGAQLPFEDESFDLVFSEYVLEHLDNPGAVFAEVQRVLRPGGKFISVAPNLWSYKSIVAWVTPHSFHTKAVRVLRGDHNRNDEDVYPTVFKANTGAALSALGKSSNMEVVNLTYVNNGPTWFQRIPVLFEIGLVFHGLLALPFLKAGRCNLVSVFIKPA